jgi:hypothetical protein
MPHPDPVSDGAGHVVVDMHRGEVLDVGLVADTNGRHVGANDALLPDGRVAPDGDVAEHDRTGRDERGRMDHVRRWTTDR